MVHGPLRRSTGSCTLCMRYADSRIYVVPEQLAELVGPASGTVELPVHLDWSEQHSYDLSDPAQTGLMYERVIREASSPYDLATYLNMEVLANLWDRIFLPARVRQLWESRSLSLTACERGKTITDDLTQAVTNGKPGDPTWALRYPPEQP